MAPPCTAQWISSFPLFKEKKHIWNLPIAQLNLIVSGPRTEKMISNLIFGVQGLRLACLPSQRGFRQNMGGLRLGWLANQAKRSLTGKWLSTLFRIIEITGRYDY